MSDPINSVINDVSDAQNDTLMVILVVTVRLRFSFVTTSPNNKM